MAAVDALHVLPQANAAPAAPPGTHAPAPARGGQAEPERRGRPRQVARRPGGTEQEEGAAREASGAEAARGGFASQLTEHLALFQRLGALEGDVAQAAERLAACLSAGGKLLICGNGGSAAQAQHLAAELAGNGARERPPLAALALGADGVALSGSASAYGFDDALARQVTALGRAGDALLLLHAAGPEANLLRAAEVARETGLLTLGLLGRHSNGLLPACHLAIVVPADSRERVEEAQAFIGHALCGLIEAGLGLA